MDVYVDDRGQGKVPGFESEDRALETAVAARAANGLQTGYTEPVTLAAVVVTAAVSAVVTKAVTSVLESPSNRRKRRAEEADSKRDEQHQRRVEQLLEQQMKVLLALADTSAGEELRTRCGEVVESVLTAAAIDRIEVATKTDSERELVREMQSISRDRITPRNPD